MCTFVYSTVETPGPVDDTVNEFMLRIIVQLIQYSIIHVEIMNHNL